jgi:hypothetical protein
LDRLAKTQLSENCAVEMYSCFDIIHRMKKILIILIVFLFLPSFGFGYMEDKLFCSLNNKEIKISLNKADGSSCKAYIAYIEQTMRHIARDLFTIQGYINHKQDVDYRQQVKKEKLAMIDKLQGVRLNVIASMKAFESNLLKKSIGYFVIKATPYRIQLVQ